MPEKELLNLINNGETNRIEFKSSFRWDVNKKEKNKNLKKEISKATCALLNSQGGLIFIGVDDNKNILGLESDLITYDPKNMEKAKDNMYMDIHKTLREDLSHTIKDNIEASYEIINEKDVFILKIEPSEIPIFQSNEKFYVRDGPESIKLTKIPEFYEYLVSHFNLVKDVNVNVKFGVEFENQQNEMNVAHKLKKIYSNEELENKLKFISNSLLSEIDTIPTKTVSPEKLDHYNNDVNTYINIMRDYLNKRNTYFKEINEIIKLNVIIINSGTIKAKDIDVYIYIPEVCMFIEEFPDSPEKPPKPPRKPTPPSIGIYNDFISRVTSIGKIFSDPTIAIPFVSPSISPPRSYYNVIVDNQRIKIHIGKLKQGYGYTPDDIYVKLFSHEEPMNLELFYEIIVGEPSKNFEGDLKLNITFD